MKKFISTAAFLAASTALASAAITTWDSAPETVSGSNVASFSVTDNFNSPWSVVLTVSAASLTDDSVQTLLAVDCTVSNSTSQPNFYAFVGVTYSAGTLSLLTWQNQKTDAEGFNHSAANDYITFVVTHSGSDQNITLSAYADANFAKAIATATHNPGSYTTNAETLCFGGLSENAQSDSANPNTNYPSNSEVSSFSIAGVAYSLDSAVTATELSEYYNSTVIPEPSAFGLLAGAGALALVAARRRRRSRAK